MLQWTTTTKANLESTNALNFFSYQKTNIIYFRLFQQNLLILAVSNEQYILTFAKVPLYVMSIGGLKRSCSVLVLFDTLDPDAPARSCSSCCPENPKY